MSGVSRTSARALAASVFPTPASPSSSRGCDRRAALFCAARLSHPLLLEGEAGVGKTEAAKALAEVLDTPLIRLQCYEGIDAAEALYEWNFPRQLLAIKV